MRKIRKYLSILNQNRIELDSSLTTDWLTDLSLSGSRFRTGRLVGLLKSRMSVAMWMWKGSRVSRWVLPGMTAVCFLSVSWLLCFFIDGNLRTGDEYRRGSSHEGLNKVYTNILWNKKSSRLPKILVFIPQVTSNHADFSRTSRARSPASEDFLCRVLRLMAQGFLISHDFLRWSGVKFSFLAPNGEFLSEEWIPSSETEPWWATSCGPPSASINEGNEACVSPHRSQSFTWLE